MARKSSRSRSSSRKSSKSSNSVCGIKMPSLNDMCSSKDMCGDLGKCLPFDCCNDKSLLKCEMAPRLMALKMQECQQNLKNKIERMRVINEIQQEARERQLDCQERMLNAYSNFVTAAMPAGGYGGYQLLRNGSGKVYTNDQGNPLYEQTQSSRYEPYAGVYRRVAQGKYPVNPLPGPAVGPFTDYDTFSDYGDEGFSGSYY